MSAVQKNVKIWMRVSAGLLLLWQTAPVLAQTPTPNASIQLAQVTPAPPQAPAIPPPQDIILPPPSTPQAPAPNTLPPQLPPPEELLQPPPSTPTPPEVDPSKVPGAFKVERFDFTGNTAFSTEKLRQVVAPYTNRPITFAELLQARSAVTQLYVDNGYITSGALISPQTLNSGSVTIQVVEGKLEDIKVTGTERFNPNYVRSRLAGSASLSRLAVASMGALNVPRLLEALRLLQLNPLIQSISAELSAGTRPATSLLTVNVQEAESFSTQANLSNNRSPSVGSFRRGLQITEANLLGIGDSISFGYDNTQGSDAVDFSYSLPFNPRNGTLSVSYNNTTSRVIEPPFDRIDIQASSGYFDLTLRQPLAQSPAQEFALGLTASRRESNTSLLGIPFPLSPGADDNGSTRISALRFFQEFTQRNSQQVVSARSQFSLGLGAFNATVNNTAPDSRFFSWRGQAQLVRLLAPETLFLVRGDVQLADRSLVPLDQIGLGGADSLRGYRVDTLLSDNGAIFSTEVRLPIVRIPQSQSILHLIPFVDVGTAWNNGGTNINPNTLASVGLGLQWQQGNNFTARLDWGIPLISVDSSKRTLQENGVYFSVIFNPF